MTTTRSRGGPVGQGRVQGQAHHLLGRLLGVGPRLGPESDAAPDELGRPGRTLPGPAGALLPVGLGPASPDLGPGLRRLGPSPGRGQLGRHHLVEDGSVRLDAEDLGVELDLTELGAVHRAAGGDAGDGLGAGQAPGWRPDRRRPVRSRRRWPSRATTPFTRGALTASRRTTIPPRGPGTAPLTKMIWRSGSDWTISRLRVVTCWAPMRPAIFVPLNTREGVAHAPMEPGARCILWLPWEAPWPLKLCRFMAPANPLPLDTAVASTSSPGLHDLGGQLLADLVGRRVVDPQLDQAAAGIDAGRVVVATLGLVEGGGPSVAPGHLQGGVAFLLPGLHLDDPDRGDAQDRDRHRPVLVVPDLGHPHFLAHDRLGGHSPLPSLSVRHACRYSGRALVRADPSPSSCPGCDRRGGAPLPCQSGWHADAPPGRTERSARLVAVRGPRGTRALGHVLCGCSRCGPTPEPTGDYIPPGRTPKAAAWGPGARRSGS